MRALFITVAASVAALLTFGGQAQAQANRTFVSGHGSDGNSCSVSAPCRTFAQAITQTNAGGEITVLDSAGYGPVTIDKSITITNPGGVEAGITTSTMNIAIVVIPQSPFVVTLRGLTLEGAGIGQNGIVFRPSAAGTLQIIDCVVKDFTSPGIVIVPEIGGPTLLTAHVLIKNSIVSNNGQSGIQLIPQTTSTVLDFAIDHITVVGNGTNGDDAGIQVNSGQLGIVQGTISSSLIQQNLIGVNILGTHGRATVIMNSSIIFNDESDINNGASAIGVYLLNFNTINKFVNSGSVFSDQTNTVISPSGNAFTPLARQ